MLEIGVGDWAAASLGLMGNTTLEVVPSLLFSSYIVAVDPVAVKLSCLKIVNCNF